MYSHILLPVDGTELSQKAVQAGLELAQKLGAKVTAFVAEPMPPLPHMGTNPSLYARESEAHMERTEHHARELLGAIKAQGATVGVAVEAKFQRTDMIDDAIVNAAEEFGCDMILMATHGRGALGEMLFGSHTKTVLAKSKLPILILH